MRVHVCPCVFMCMPKCRRAHRENSEGMCRFRHSGALWKPSAFPPDWSHSHASLLHDHYTVTFDSASPQPAGLGPSSGSCWQRLKSGAEVRLEAGGPAFWLKYLLFLMTSDWSVCGQGWDSGSDNGWARNCWVLVSGRDQFCWFLVPLMSVSGEFWVCGYPKAFLSGQLIRFSFDPSIPGSGVVQSSRKTQCTKSLTSQVLSPSTHVSHVIS